MRVPLSILEEAVAVMKLAPHEHAQTTQKIAEFPQPKFINKVVDDRVKTERHIPQSKWSGTKQSRSLRFDAKTKWWTPVVQQRTDATGAVPEREAKSKSQSREFRRRSRISQLVCTGNDAIGNQTHEAGNDF